MKQAGKLTICVILVLMIFSLLTYMVIADESEDVEESIDYWDGTMAESFAGGTGAEEDPFLIDTPEQFVYFLHLRENMVLTDDDRYFYADLHYRLTRDLYFNEAFDNAISLSGYKLPTRVTSKLNKLPTLTALSYFSGVFDGGGHTLYNIYMEESAPLFGVLDGTVKNLHVSGGYASMISSRAGTFASEIREGTSYADTSVTLYGFIQNCTSTLSIAVYPSPGWKTISDVGGIAGYISTKSAEEQKGGIENCEYGGILYANCSKVGGILGVYSIEGGSLAVRNCTFRGTIYCPIGQNIGGIIGEIFNYQYRVIKSVVLENCFNFGSIYAYRQDTSKPTNHVGGMIGHCERVTTRIFRNCGFYGTIESSGDCTGGFIGSVVSENSGNATRFEKCVVYGKIQGASKVGGFIGRSTRVALFDNCIMAADVKGTGDEVGGLIGHYSTSVYSAQNMNLDLHGCDIRGTVTGVTSVGGLVGVWGGSGSGTGIRFFGTLFRTQVEARGEIGGSIGSVVQVYNGKTVPFSMVSSLYHVILTMKRDTGDIGIFAGKVADGVTCKAGTVTNTYLFAEGYHYVNYAYQKMDALPFATSTDGSVDTLLWQDAYWTDGTLLALLNGHTPQNGFANPTWLASPDGSPLYTLSVAAANIESTHEYTGDALVLPDLGGVTFQVTQWYQYSEAKNAYEMISEAPYMIGLYRVSIYYITDKGYGSVTLAQEITAVSFDLSTLRWDYTGAFQFDGTPHGVSLMEIPEIFEIQYTNAIAVDAGVYIASATVVDKSGKCNLVGEVPKCTWTIRRIVIDASSDKIFWDYDPTNPPLYSGDAISVALKSPGQSLEALQITYTGTLEATDVGTYECTATIGYNPVNVQVINMQNGGVIPLTWEILPLVLDLSAVEMKDQSVPYDGTLHEYAYPPVDLLFDIPGGILESEHIGAAYTYPGTYEYTLLVSLNPSVKENYQLVGDTVYHATLTIEKAQPRILAKGADKTYDGTPLYLSSAYLAIDNKILNFPLTYEYFYVDENGNRSPVDQVLNGGSYVAVIRFAGNDRYLPAETTVEMYVNRAIIELPGNVVLRDGKLMYTGDPLNLEVSGILPDEILDVKYSDPRTLPGVYTVTAKFIINEQNYQPLPTLSATMTILARSIFDRDYGQGVNVKFEAGGLTTLNLKVYDRKDFADFHTRSYGMFTSMKSLYRLVLRDGYTAVDPEEPILIYLPLSEAILASDKLYVVRVDISERGKYEYVDIPVVEKFDDDNPDEFACIIDRVNGEVIIKSMSTDTYGIITEDSHTMAMAWLGVSLGLGVLSGGTWLVTYLYRKKKGIPKQI